MHHLCLVPENFHHPRKKPWPINSHFLLPSPWQPPVGFLSLWIYEFWILHINGIIRYVFYVWLLSFSIMFLKVHLCCTMGLYSTRFYGWIIFYHMERPHFVSWWARLCSFAENKSQARTLRKKPLKKTACPHQDFKKKFPTTFPVVPGHCQLLHLIPLLPLSALGTEIFSLMTFYLQFFISLSGCLGSALQRVLFIAACRLL